MIMQTAQQCSLAFTIGNSLVAGLLGSLGFFINMFVISGIVYLYKKHKQKPIVSEEAAKAAADLLRK